MIICKEICVYKDYGRVLSISNGVIEVYVTLDIGPRIVFFGFIDGPNIMDSDRSSFISQSGEEYEKFYGKGKYWENLGGHRIWVAPEKFPQTLYPDLDKVEYEISEKEVVFTPKAELENGIQKQLVITMSEDNAEISVGMRITNVSNTQKEYSVWGITVCEKGGTLIIPMNTNDTNRLPNRSITIWPYTDISDERIIWNKKYVVLTCKKIKNLIKLGFDLNCGTVYYVLNDNVFIKKYEAKHPFSKYPHGNCSFETFLDSNIMEIESLSELKIVNPNETLEFTENWSLKKTTGTIDYQSEKEIDELVKTLQLQ